MSRKQLLIVFIIVAIVLAVIIVLLVTGGATPVNSTEDATGDVVVSEGDSPPEEVELADIVDASVVDEGGQIVLEATMATEVPDDLGGQGMDWKWEISEGGAVTWIVSANLDVGENATVFSPSTGTTFSTIDDRLPGELTIEGSTIRVALDVAEIDGFPTDFTWKLTTKLDGAKGDAGSATADDFAPDRGFGEFPLPE
jgi:hypothetical protein